MKFLKVTGIVFFCLAFIGGISAAMIRPRNDMLPMILISCICLSVVEFLIISLVKDYREKSLNNAAAQYRESQIREGDEYYKGKEKEGNTYYQQKVEETDKQIEKLSAEIENLKAEQSALQLDNFINVTRTDEYDHLKSDEIKNELSLLRLDQEKLLKEEKALATLSNSPNSKKALLAQKKQILRCFNSECLHIIDGVTVKNIDTARARITRAFETINKIFEVDGIQITQKYLASKYKELSLVYAYMVKIEEERETNKAIREQMREEEKVRREIEREKQKIQKEETQFSNEINKLMGYMQKSHDDIERQLYIDKIHELEEKLKALEKDKENVLQREQNTRAGFVYIISNIGSFGEQVFKIGMTRRLEPMDRIAELSSASVPFPFDVHAIIFSEDAPALENILHQHFDAQRINKVNIRKEFFRVDLQEIKRVVLEHHNATVKFVDIPDAVEYRETVKMEQAAVV